MPSRLPRFAGALFLCLFLTAAAFVRAEPAKSRPDPKPEPKKETPADPFPGVTARDLDAPPKKGAAESPAELPADPFDADLSSLKTTEIDGALLDPDAVRAIVARVRPAIVKITHLSRDGGVLGTGSGFIISEEGLVATNNHVIGTARPIKVELHDGAECAVTEIHAWDRPADLAILKIDPGSHPLQALKPGAPGDAVQGQAVLGFGNPQGLEFSVVSGIISAVRRLDEDFPVEGEIPEFPMIQLAMPIEMGNSGGPVVDLNGNALGIVTIKHMVTPNLGFAVPIAQLRPLLDKPNPVAMDQWETIGALDPEAWTGVMGARWTQRGGVINAEGVGDGFGGRALCLSERPVPKPPFDIAVQVKLDDESGAAGLVFASDGSEKHYGFYPSGGRLRLTRFEGPDVYSWTILNQTDSLAYQPGEWNHLRVHVTDEKIEGFVNGDKVLEAGDDILRGGQAGLCTFRGAGAEFRNFRIGKDLAAPEASAEVIAEMNRQIDGFVASGDRTGEFLDELSADKETGRRLLLERAGQLEDRARAIRRITGDLHRRDIARRLEKALAGPEAKIDLFAAALLIAQHDQPDLDTGFYLEEFGRLVRRAGEFIGQDDGGRSMNARRKAERLAEFLFRKSGFHGGRSEYYHPGNSYLNEVLDYREGLPISLSVLFIEAARRLEIDGVGGVPLPGHFLVGQFNGRKDDDGKPDVRLFDVFDGGKQITRQEAETISWKTTGAFPPGAAFQPAGSRDILIRMLRNLIGVPMNEKRPEDARGHIELVLAISPDESQERFQRAILRYQSGDPKGAREDVEWLLDRRPPGLDYDRLGSFLDRLNREIAGEE